MEFATRIKQREYTTKQAIIITLLASLFTAICAQIHFYLPNNPVPVTMQVFAVVVCAFLLGSKLAFISQVQYIIGGVMGLPVFAGFKAGAIWLIGPTGGYL
ncbi:MAG: biotin transporter BioY, partial [Armatimonadota bacterium]